MVSLVWETAPGSTLRLLTEIQDLMQAAASIKWRGLESWSTQFAAEYKCRDKRHYILLTLWPEPTD